MNIFEISTELQNIYNVIEENEGEITPEIEEALSINEENLRTKLTDYTNLISSLKVDVEACAAEKKRIDLVKQSKERLIEKLSNIVAEAVSTFGSETKSGGKYYDLGTKKIQVRNTEKCEVNDDYIDNVNETFKQFIDNISRNGLLGQDVTKEFMEKVGSGFDGTDLDNVKLTITLDKHIYDVTNGSDEQLINLLKNYDVKLNCDVSKSECKNVLKSGTGLSFAKLIPSKSITIK